MTDVFDDFELVDDGSSTSSYEIIEKHDSMPGNADEDAGIKWETELIPDELEPMARTLYLIYAMCKKYPRLNRIKHTLKDMWCDGDQRLMKSVLFIEKGQVDECALQLWRDARAYSAPPVPVLPQGSEQVDKQRPQISEELREMRDLFGLTTKPLSELIDYFMYSAKECGGSFDRSQFLEVVGRVIDTHTDINEATVTRLLDRLLDALDTKGAGCVGPHDLSIAASLLCHGSSEEKTKVAFRLFDADHSHTITEQEMRAYYSVVFHVLFELVPSSAAAAEVSAEELAEVTSNSLFEQADLNHDGKIDWAEFKKWHKTENVAQQFMQ